MRKILFLIFIFNANTAFTLPEDLWIDRPTSNETCNNEPQKREKDWFEYPSEFCYGKCLDGSFSEKQSPSEGALKQEGMCGQTSIVNMIEMGCGVKLSDNLVDEFVRDSTPGVKPETFVNGINEIVEIIHDQSVVDCDFNKFKKYNSRSSEEFISDLFLLLGQGSGEHTLKRRNNNGIIVERTPVAVFVQNPNKGWLGAHWVTVVDIEEYKDNCTAVVNHWGHQFKLPCEDLARLAKKGDQYPTVGAYTMISEGND